METLGNQSSLPLAFGVHHAAKDAPSQIVRQIESAAHALAVMIRAGHHKLDYVAACVGKSRSYISRMQNGVRPIPEKLVGPLCAATGSNLLRQFLSLQAALEGICEVERLADLMRSANEEVRVPAKAGRVHPGYRVQPAHDARADRRAPVPMRARAGQGGSPALGYAAA
ncbi:hypothetical protein [Stenotrophomonas sp. BIGb0135]|uniref:hypothetical protein n=1 Tax=Stenotrophomonas sp. BIGb0135 TaxID=2940620 RepID=UPI002166E031|nr:hypothetical protein [Stenotrophomonas sp. BIGb0135]MCS4234441.1 hypothetical protein [Stenotrophomonas sp. BIGb0135]